MVDSQRKCIVTGQSDDRASLIRFVLSPEGRVVADIAEKLPGRGAWVTSEHTTLHQAIERKAFTRAFRNPAQCDSALIVQCKQQLESRVLSLLAMSRKAGGAVSGLSKVSEALGHGDVLCLLQASDAKASDLEKVKRLCSGQKIYTVMDSLQLAQVFAKEHVVYVALLNQPVNEKIVKEIGRLAGFSQQDTL